MIGVNITDFKNLLNLAGAFSAEATFKIKDDRMDLSVLDTAHVAMAKGAITITGEPEVDEFTVDVEKMLKALAVTGDNVQMNIADGLLTLTGDKSKVKVSLINPEFSNLKDPKFEVKATGSIQPSRLKTAFAYGTLSKADHIVITVNDGKLFFETGEYPNVATIEGDEDGYGTATAGFMLDYIQSIVDLATKAKSLLKVGLGGTDYPAKFSWTGETAVYSVLLAPRIES